MLAFILKFLFIYMACMYISIKSFSLQKITLIKQFVVSFILSIMSYLFSLYSMDTYYIFPLLILWIYISILNASPLKSFIVIVISFTINLCFFAVLGFIFALLLSPIFTPNIRLPLMSLFSGISLVFATRKLLNIKRFRNGISFLFSTMHINTLTILCFILIYLPIYTFNLFNTSKPEITFAVTFLPYLLGFAFLIYWWQAQITKAYRRNLELRELESMRTEMAELKLKMQDLTEENERLARITHRDNTLISALKNATVKYLSTDFANPTVALETRDQLLENINTLSAGRNSLADTHKEKSSRKFETGLKLLDALLHEMDEKALEMNISFAVHMGTSLDNFIPEEISEEDLVHTVDDLLKNAFKATTSCEKRMVQLQFYKLGKHFVVEVADTGIPFEVKSLVNMGIEKLTTYEDGSGIGLVDIWTTKEKYGATYHLDECINAAPFSKKVSLTFDKKNRYSIRTLRKDEILQMSRRADLQVYDYNEQ